MKMLTDVGNKEECESIKDKNGNQLAEYTNMQANVTDLRGIVINGVCLPINCSQQTLDEFSTSFVGLINEVIGILPKIGINIHILIFRTNFTQVNMEFFAIDYDDQ